MRYHFANDTVTGLMAGGISEDFSEGRGGWYTDFRGFSTSGVGQVCDDYMATYCQQVKPNVLLMLTAPPVRFVCEPGPGTMSTAPKVAVAIDLPKSRPVHGIIFLSDFLSEEQLAQLYEIVGFNGIIGADCSAENQAAYTELMQQHIDEILNGTSDAESQHNYRAMLALAGSINVRS